MTNCTTAALRRTLVIAPALTGLLAIASPGMLAGQTVFYACYVPSSGTVYRIKEPGLPTECGTSKKQGVTMQHVEFSWSPGVSDHGSLAGLDNDDHTQYLLADGVRSSTNGFAVNGTLHEGSIPASGPGTRLMWYPAKAAFRAGFVNSNQWDEASIGLFSVAMGGVAAATGESSVALGTGSWATGQNAVALGGGTAAGVESLGFAGAASGGGAVAIGSNTLASGERSVALGSFANTADKNGAFVYGDASTFTHVNAVAENQFVVRAAQFWFGNNNNVTSSLGRFIETSTGAYLSSGGTWTNSSDVNRKTAFEDVDGDDVLAGVAALPIRRWSYKDEDESVRHLGPTAQDFSAAFGLGDTDKAIATVDADGVSFAAIQALEKRTAELQRENASLRQSVDSLRSVNDELRAELRALARRVDDLGPRAIRR